MGKEICMVVYYENIMVFYLCSSMPACHINTDSVHNVEPSLASHMLIDVIRVSSRPHFYCIGCMCLRCAVTTLYVVTNVGPETRVSHSTV